MDGCQELEKAEYIASRRDAMCENMTGSRCSLVARQSFVVRRLSFAIRRFLLAHTSRSATSAFASSERLTTAAERPASPS
jgi:hypothetical protein